MTNLKMDANKTEDLRDITELKKAKEDSRGLTDWKIVRGKLMRDLKTAGHSSQFIKSVVTGLKRSSIYGR